MSSGEAIDPREEAKRAAGEQAATYVTSGMRLGLGTGSTVRYFLEGLARRLDEGELKEIQGVPTSLQTRDRAQALGIPLMELAEAEELDLAVDGADEVSPDLDLIKGLGGALLREKMVVQASRRFVVVADTGKTVEQLGNQAPLPVEVVSFAWQSHLPFFRSTGARPEPRKTADGELFVTDNGNVIVDLHFDGGIPDPYGLDALLRMRAGVVETGLFLGMAHTALIAPLGGEGPLRIMNREREMG